MSKEFVGLTIDKDIVETIEKRRGLVARSAYFNHVLRTALNTENKGSPAED